MPSLELALEEYPRVLERFTQFLRLYPADACWEWQGYRVEKGYGQFGYGRIGVVCRAHRVAYHLFRGVIPEGLQVLHSCDNPACVNPAHLHLGTDADNKREAVERRRMSQGGDHWMRKYPERVLRGKDHPWRRHPEKIPVGEATSGARLTDSAVLEIRRLWGSGASSVVLADRFGVSAATIADAATGRCWKHLPNAQPNRMHRRVLDPRRRERGSNAKLKYDEVVAIKRQLSAGASPKVLAARFGVAVGTIKSIKNGYNWKHVGVSDDR